MNEIGTKERPLRVAIIGSGPSGFYAAEALFKSSIQVETHLFDRLPTPFGLLRGGVAPDHQQLKSVSRAYEKIAQDDRFLFYGNVTIGKDVTVEELKEYYDTIIFATGAETDKSLGIEGEVLEGSHTATEFVGWYNGHPDYQNRKFDLTQKSVAIIGVGNVAVDVARILSKTPEELKSSDITQNALDQLSNSQIETIYLIGRRGPAQAAFTQLEVKELGHLADCDAIVSPEEMILSDTDLKELELPKKNKVRKVVEILQSISEQKSRGCRKQLKIKFFRSPVRYEGGARIERVVLEKNDLLGEPGQQKVKGSGDYESIDAGLVFRSIGYRGVSIPGVPFDDGKGVIPNEMGRVVENNNVLKGLYTTGWIKRGASGVIGTNRADSVETVNGVVEDLTHLDPCSTPDTTTFERLLKQRDVKWISFQDWQKIDSLEVELGQKVGKPREKFVRIQDMLDVLK